MSPSRACRLALAALVALMTVSSTLANIYKTDSLNFTYAAPPYWLNIEWDLKETRYILDGNCTSVVLPGPLAQPCGSGLLRALQIEVGDDAPLGLQAGAPEPGLMLPAVTVRRTPLVGKKGSEDCSGDVSFTVYGQCYPNRPLAA